MTDDLLTNFRSEILLPDEATAQDLYVRATSAPRRAPRHRLAVAIVTAAATGAAVAALVVSTGQTPKRRAMPMGFDPMALSFVRNGQSLASIAATIQAPIGGATMRLQVLRTEPSQLLPAMNHVPGSAQIVFQEQAAMTDISPPPTGPGGTVALSTWSGTLSPTDWTGGCQDELYNVSAVVVPAGSSYDDPPDGSQSVSSNWFRCSGS